jgi:diguanylate cyclase (GGDEF)-like protein
VVRRPDEAPPPAGRLGGVLLCLGAVMEMVLASLVPSYSNGHPLAVIVPASIAVLVGAGCIIAGPRTPRLLTAVLPTFAAELICLSMWVSNTPLDGSELLFVWCVFFAGYYLGYGEALANTAAIAVSYGVVVVDRRGASLGFPPAVELATTLVVACLLLNQLRRRAAASLDEARAEARTDALTGLLNRRGLNEVALRECERAERDGRPLTVWMVDLDHFKRLNDALGHAAGDRALASVAEVLRAQLRGVDVIARVGGEEFCVLLPNCRTADAFLRAEALREAVQYEFRDWDQPVTVSIGIAAWTPGDADASRVMDAADDALYAAKAGGRNMSQVSHGVRTGRMIVTEQR